MFTEEWWRPQWRRAAVDAGGLRVQRVDVGFALALHRQQVTAGQRRIALDQVLEVLDDRRGYARLLQTMHGAPGVEVAGPRLDQRIELVLVLFACLEGGEARIGGEFGAADRGAERVPLIV